MASVICRRSQRLILNFGDTVAAHVRSMASEVGGVVPKQELREFVKRCMMTVGSKRDHAESLAELLVAADYRGHFSHGLNRLDMYINDVKTGITVSDKEPSLEKQTAATALIDGNNVLGPVVGKLAMDTAIHKAQTAGVGWVTCKGSNHFGIAGWYSMRAAEKGLLGMAFTNTSPLVFPTRAKQPILGTNPISLAAPANDGDSFVLDMATSTAALGKIELHDRKNIPIPNGWGANSEGKETNEPAEVLNGGGQLPLGGSELTGGYKGYGLAMMVEIFCGILGGAAYGPNVRKWRTSDEIANLGHCFVAIDPEAFAPGFRDRMSDLMSICRGLEPISGETEVLVAGDPERQHMAKCDAAGGIPYHPNQIKFANDIAEKLSIAPMKLKS
ncbi:uncharacterized oxidoreductase YjmC-like [Liolophura sinensis]|uniref:uncharacterized oxidoreductase YjmC-like n=1 Tax=Liolophura sinensis TaxID=3198878 RepID=UPI00315895EE